MTMTKAEREEKVEGLLAGLERGISRLADHPDEWRAWLNTQIKFHHYSFRNCLLIMEQMPEASRVAGYNRWKKLGRQVRRGESGILIWAPRRIRDRENEKDGQKRYKLIGFKMTSVFDISQTDGEPLDDPIAIKGDDFSEMLATMMAAVEASGLPVEHEFMGSAWGSTDGRVVRLRPDLDANMALSTLAHEWAHCELDHIGKRESTSIAELEAQSVAYVVCGALGLDVSEFSFNYVANWTNANESNREAVLDQVKASAEGIGKAAKTILDAMASAMAPEEVAEAA